MSNLHNFLLSPLDQMVADLPPERRRQIMLDYDELERKGTNGDTVLREEAGSIYRRLQGRPTGFDAAYMMFVGLSAHKVASIEALAEAEDLVLHDRRVLSERLVAEIASLPRQDLLARLDEIQERAGRICNAEICTETEAPSP